MPRPSRPWHSLAGMAWACYVTCHGHDLLETLTLINFKRLIRLATSLFRTPPSPVMEFPRVGNERSAKLWNVLPLHNRDSKTVQLEVVDHEHFCTKHRGGRHDCLRVHLQSVLVFLRILQCTHPCTILQALITFPTKSNISSKKFDTKN